MRLCLSAAAMAATLLSFGSVFANDFDSCHLSVNEAGCGAHPVCGEAGGRHGRCRGRCFGGDGGDVCGNGGQYGGCDAHGCQLHGNRHHYEGRDRFFNCGCNGSYNYPVPPLYTYHWPGMYKAVRMTDYHSPWRFPPIKPFTEDVIPAVTNVEVDGNLLPVAAYRVVDGAASLPGQPESMSQKLLKLQR
jgi:hypothetical protein